MEQFGASGLRTLCLAYKELSIHAYEIWNEKFVQAKSSLSDRDKKLDEVQFFHTLVAFICMSMAIINLFVFLDLFSLEKVKFEKAIGCLYID